ncbi:hypothetical protein D0867_00987 [Hortaea werneckii]|uniref:Uncharacterized protein n=1 Tax=Hortaea werneckii TaxID=91943 RepID=A0A3M7AC50_HORWE|nr:hypothetical protein D0867_00987 [Hortaea werneckii]
MKPSCARRILTQHPSIVISVFAIVILSAIGSMFAKGHHTMMGSEEDPKDGGKVAAAVFGAVAVYGVRDKEYPEKIRETGNRIKWLTQQTGFPRVLRTPGLTAQEAKSTG